MCEFVKIRMMKLSFHLSTFRLLWIVFVTSPIHMHFHFCASAACATAKNSIAAYSLSNSTFNYTNLYTDLFKGYCSNPISDTQALSAKIAKAVDAYATAVATTLAHYNLYVCSCTVPVVCGATGPCSNAYSVVAADIQAVALAQAYAVQEALTSVSDCYGEALSQAYAYAEVRTRLFVRPTERNGRRDGSSIVCCIYATILMD